MTEHLLTITVYCEGPLDDGGNPTHKRFEWAPWTRSSVPAAASTEKGQTRMGEVPIWLAQQGTTERAGLAQPRRKAERDIDKLRLKCPICGFDEQRRFDRWSFNQALERLHLADQHDIEVRMFVKYCLT